MFDRSGFSIDQIRIFVEELLIMGNHLSFLINFEVLLHLFWATLQVGLFSEFLQSFCQIKISHLKDSDHPLKLLQLCL